MAHSSAEVPPDEMPPDEVPPMTWHGGSDAARLHIVTGKGGTGKTTVAAALATALATQGKRVLLIEVEERQGISQVLDVAPLGTQEIEVASGLEGGSVWGLSVEAGTALVEYLRLFYRLGRAGDVLQKIGAIEFATTIAPGVRDVLIGGKVYESVRRTTAGRPPGSRRGRDQAAPPAYDAVVQDGSGASSTCRANWLTWPGWARSASSPMPSRSCCTPRPPWCTW